MLNRKLSIFTASIFALGITVYAQDDVDAAQQALWNATENGEQVDNFTTDQPDEPTPQCIGDGCDEPQVNASSTETVQEQTSTEGNETAEAANPTDAQSAELAKDSSNAQVAANTSSGELAADEEYCTEADSTNTECVDVETEEPEDKSDTYDRYITENAQQYQARKEGFSRSIQLGFHVAGGMNTFFGKKSDGWDLGYLLNGGIMVKLPAGVRHLNLIPELDFGYRNYGYEGKSDYAKNEATIDMFLFEIPIILRYSFDDDGFFAGIGANLGLKLSGSSEFKYKYNSDIVIKDDETSGTRHNTLPSAGVELGAIANLGYNINRWFAIDLRVVQSFTNLLNADNVAEKNFTKSDLLSFYTTLGVAFMLF